MDVAQYIAQRPSQQQELFLPALKSARMGTLAPLCFTACASPVLNLARRACAMLPCCDASRSQPILTALTPLSRSDQPIVGRRPIAIRGSEPPRGDASRAAFFRSAAFRLRRGARRFRLPRIQ